MKITDHEFLRGANGQCCHSWYTHGSGTELEICHGTEADHTKTGVQQQRDLRFGGGLAQRDGMHGAKGQALRVAQEEQPADARLARVLAAHEQVMHALLFYGDPENYHAIAVWADRPAGAFADDYDDEHGHPDYDRPMHGSRARAAIKAWTEATQPPHLHDYYCGPDCTGDD